MPLPHSRLMNSIISRRGSVQGLNGMKRTNPISDRSAPESPTHAQSSIESKN